MDYEPFPGMSKPTSLKLPLKKVLKWTAMVMGTVMAIAAALAAILYLSGGRQRVTGAVSFYVLGHKPALHYLDIEKNGKDYRLNQGDILELAGRDEFVIKQVRTDVLSDRNISVDVEFIGNENDFRKLLKGTELVQMVVAAGSSSDASGRPPLSPRVLVKYGSQIVGTISIKTKVTPQDWLQQSGASENLSSRIEQLQKALALNPSDDNVRRVLAGLYQQAGLADKAVEHYQILLSSNPDDVFILTELVKAYMGRRKYNEVIDNCRRIVALEPKNAAAFAHLGYAYGELGDWNRAIESYETSLGIDEGNPPVRLRLREAYEKAKQHGAAKIDQSVLKPRTPDSGGLAGLAGLADLDFKERRYGAAVKKYEQLARSSPPRPSIYANLGYAYTELKNYAESAKNYEKALKAGAKDPQIYYNLGFAYEKLGREKDAIGAYEKYEKDKPSLQVTQTLAELYLSEKRYDQAIQAYRKLIRNNPKKAAWYASLGYVYGRKNDINNEIENYRTALRYDPEDDETCYRLAEAYERKGMYEEAISAYSSAYDLNPDLSQAARKIPRLKIKILEKKHQES